MKITRAHPPADLQSVDAEGSTPLPDAPEAAPDNDLFVAEPPAAFTFAAAPEEPPTPTPPSARLSQSLPRTAIPRAEPAVIPAKVGPAWPIYALAAVVSILWATAPIAFALGYRRDIPPFQNDTFALAVLGLLAVGPVALVWLAAFMVREGQKLSAETRRAKALADEMSGPALLAGARSSDVVRGIREEIIHAAEAAQEARDTLLALRQALALESEQLIEAAAQSTRTAQSLTGALGKERLAMVGLAHTLDTQATSVTDAIAHQARMVAEASDLAETQLREAEASLAARAADLAAAAGEAGDMARVVGDDLMRHVARLESAGVSVSQQIEAVEGGLTQQRSALINVGHALRADHDAFAAESETHSARLAEFISQARLSAMEMSDRALKGGESLRQLMADASNQFRIMADAAASEREEFSQASRLSLEAVADVAAGERARLEDQTRGAVEALARAAEETRAAAARHAEAARDQVDQLSEAAFSAGQNANQAFEARLNDARRLIEQSAQLVEDAGAATARKLDEGATAARATLDELQALLTTVEDRMARLPAAARGQAAEVHAAVAEGMDQLLDQARRTAQETQAIDAAFQERVRRNYEMLSEAVRLMGAVAGNAPPAAAPPVSSGPPVASAPAPKARPPIAAPRPSRPAPAAASTSDVTFEPPAPMLRPGPPAYAPLDAGSGERPRLKLTPTASDEDFSSIFEAAGGRTPEPAPDQIGGDGWTWKELLSSIDEPEAAASHQYEAAIVAEIAAIGIDGEALLPGSRVEEIAAAIQTGDIDGAREVVRRLAPAASRRITRRLFSDAALRGRVSEFLAHYHGRLNEASDQDQAGYRVAGLLNTDAGRAYLLFDAAAGDLV